MVILFYIYELLEVLVRFLDRVYIFYNYLFETKDDCDELDLELGTKKISDTVMKKKASKRA